MSYPAGAASILAYEPVAVGESPIRGLISHPRDVGFLAAEFEALVPAPVDAGSGGFNIAHGTAPHGALSLGTSDTAQDETETYRLSDKGYVARPDDLIGPQPYRSLMSVAFAMDGEISLDPTATGGLWSAVWGEMILLNPRDTSGVGFWDQIFSSRVVDGRQVRVLMGRKSYDAARGLHVDPSYADLTEIFRGIAEPWFLDDTTLRIPLRDASWLLEKPVQTSFYAGSGALEGTSDLTGKPRPMARGGTAARPIRNVTPVLVDPTNRIYQYTDGAGTVEAIYEGGDTNAITFQADTTDLYAGSTNIGQYRTDNSKGLLQLGSSATRPITADVTGEYPTAGAQTTVVDLARYLLEDDAGISPGLLDLASFIGLAAVYPYTAGYWIPTEPRSVLQVAADILRSIDARLVTNRSGKLRPMAVKAPAGIAKDTYTTADIVRVRPVPLPDNLAPPTWRWQVGYERNHTIQTSDLDPDVTDARKQFLAEEFRLNGWSDVALKARFTRPNDLTLPTVLLDGADAQTMADRLGAMWGVKRRLYEVECWLKPLERELGDNIVIKYPLEDFAAGKQAVIVGKQYRASEQRVVITVLV